MVLSNKRFWLISENCKKYPLQKREKELPPVTPIVFWNLQNTTFSGNPFEIAFDNRLKGGTEVVAQKCFVKKVFLENSKSSLENTCARVSISITLQGLDLQLY